MFVVEKSGMKKGYLVERIDSIYFKKVKGNFSVSVTLDECISDDPANPKLIISTKRSKYCYNYRLAVVPKNIADQYQSDAAVTAYFDWRGGDMFSKDYDHAEFSNFDIDFVRGSEYTILALAYDGYGVGCESSRVNFKFGNIYDGNPTVDCTIDDVDMQEATLTMTANEDCGEFYTCIFKAGEAEQNYFKWSGMFGFTCMGDMIKEFSGHAHTGTYTHTWTQLIPATDYELYIQPCDKKGVYGEMVIVPLTTKVMGGDGIAEMNIKIGEFGSQPDQEGNILYWQQVIYTPNDQCAAHRDMIITKEALEDGTWTEDRFIKYMKNEKDPQNPENEYWDYYGVDDAKFNAEPNTEYVAYSISKNAKGEWGPVAKVPFTTPDAAEPATRPVKAQILQRTNASNDYRLPDGHIVEKHMMVRE